MYLTEQQIAQVVQTNLNTIADSLLTDTTITHKVVFYVTPNIQTYDRMVDMEFEVGTDILYTPVLLRRVSSSMKDDFVQGTYTEGFVCEVLAYDTDRQDVEAIFNQYVYSESEVDEKTIEEWTVIKANTSRLQFVNTYPATDGTDMERVHYMFNFTWQFILGGIMDSDSTFTIDGTQIDVLQVAFASDKLAISNIAYGTNTSLIGATGFTLTLTIPVQNLTANKALFADLLSKKYNKSYTIVWAIANYNTSTYTMALRSGTVNYQRDQLISYNLTFEEALPRTSITVDTITLPVLDFNIKRIVTVLDKPNGTEIKHTPSNTKYQLTMKFGYISSVAKSRELLQAILDKNYMLNTYVIALAITGGVTKSYTVHLADGTYSHSQTGELMYDCVFMEADLNGL